MRNEDGSLRRGVVIAAFVIAIAFVVLTSTVRHRDDFLFDHDSRFWFVAGQCWWAGQSPYSHETFLQTWTASFGEPPRFRSAFVYPGSLLPLSLLLGALEWDTARFVMRALNFLSLGGCLWLMRRVARADHDGPVPPWRDVWVAAAAVVPGVGLTIFQGQLSLVVTFGICAAWVALRERQNVLFVVGVLLASIKPQLAIVALLFLFVWFRDRRTLLAIAVAIAANALVLLWTTPAQFLVDCRASLAEHAAQEFNRPDNYDSLPTHVFDGAAGKVMEWIGVLGACAAAIGLGSRSRARVAALPHAEIRLFQIAIVCVGALMPVHRYDLAIQLPLVATAWALGTAWRRGLLFALVFAHGGASWAAWHLQHWFLITVDYHELAAELSVVELIALTIWWCGDVARSSAGPMLSRAGERCT